MKRDLVASVLRSRWTFHLGAITLTSIFWGSGIGKILDFNAAIEEMRHFGLNPAPLFALATITVQLGASLLIVTGSRWAWLGAGALSAFTLLTIPVAHRFWEMEGAIAFLEKAIVFEHIALVGGLLLVAALAEMRRAGPGNASGTR